MHVELFAHRHVVVVPAGVGVAPPLRREGAYVRGGRCYGPLATLEPTGLVEVSPAAATPTLGALFAAWGQPLGPRVLAGFRGSPVRVYVGGVPRGGDPGSVPLRPHDVVVLETAGRVVPHDSYAFPAQS